jgi:hypothetical protein
MSFFKPNRDFEREIHAAYATAVTMAAAERARGRAEALSHHAMPRGGARIVCVPDGEDTLLVNTNYGGAIEEFGSVNSPTYAPLRRGVRAAGFRLSSSEG